MPPPGPPAGPPAWPAPPIPPKPDSKLLRPRTRWYWVAGTPLPAASIFSIVVNVFEESLAVPDWMDIFSPLLLMLSFLVTGIALATVLILRSSHMARLRTDQIRTTHAAHYARFAPPGAPGGPPFPYFPYFPPPVPPRPPVADIPSKDRRPRRLWFVAALLAPPAFVGAGLLILTLAGANAFTESEPPELVSDVIVGGESTTLTVTYEDRSFLGLYSSPRNAEPGHCVIEGLGYARLSDRQIGHSWDEWRLEHKVLVDTPGEYTLTCSGSSDQAYVIAETRTAIKADDHGFATAATIMLSGFLGIITMIGAVIIIGIRRVTYPERIARQGRQPHPGR